MIGDSFSIATEGYLDGPGSIAVNGYLTFRVTVVAPIETSKDFNSGGFTPKKKKKKDEPVVRRINLVEDHEEHVKEPVGDDEEILMFLKIFAKLCA